MTRCRRDIDCKGARRYRERLLKRNLNLSKKWKPPEGVGIKVVYIAEAYPKSGQFVYDVESPMSWLSNGIIDDLQNGLRHPGFWGIQGKADLLCRLRMNGVVVIDCCRCVVDKCGMSKKERDAAVRHCFSKHSRRRLNRIIKDHEPALRFAFPMHKGRQRGGDLLSDINDMSNARVKPWHYATAAQEKSSQVTRGKRGGV